MHIKRSSAFMFVAIAVVATGVSLQLVRSLPFLGVMEAWVQDFRIANLLVEEQRHPDIVVVAITEDTLKPFPYRSPIDRAFLKDVLEKLQAKGARAIGLDILFDQPTELDKDRGLAKTLRTVEAATPLVVAYAGEREGLDVQQAQYLRNFIPPEARAFANLVKDPFDGVVRSIFAGRDDANGKFVRAMVPSLAEKLGLEAPADQTPILWRGRPADGGRAFRVIPAHTLAVIPDSLIKNKIVFIGVDLTLTDLHRTPFVAGIGKREELLTPGVLVHAHAMAQILDKQQLKLVSTAEQAALVLVFIVLTIALMALFGIERLTMRMAVLTGCVLLLWLGGFFVFQLYRVMIPLVAPTIGVALSMWMVEMLFGRQQRQEKKMVRNAFSHYLSPALVDQLVRHPDRLRLSGEKRDMSILFCDVRGFTSISESLSPEALTKLIHNLLTPLTTVILDHGGTVDKYMGDCIMAFWNAPLDDPDHARQSCLSALDMQAAMEPLNSALAEEAKSEGRVHAPLMVGIGVNSGDMVVGNMGSGQRFDYSVLGDQVNLASRIEGQCKTYGVGIIVGENTQSRIPDFATLEIDLIRVVGKTVPVRIFALLGDDKVGSMADFKALRDANAKMLNAYRNQDWPGARESLQNCRGYCGEFDLSVFYDLYEMRISQFEKSDPGQNWDGVFVMQHK